MASFITLLLIFFILDNKSFKTITDLYLLILGYLYYSSVGSLFNSELLKNVALSV